MWLAGDTIRIQRHIALDDHLKCRASVEPHVVTARQERARDSDASANACAHACSGAAAAAEYSYQRASFCPPNSAIGGFASFLSTLTVVATPSR